MREIKKYLPFWKELLELESQYHTAVNDLETKMQEKLQDNGLMFFFCDGDCAGIGSHDREMKLIHSTDLDEAINENT